MTMAKNIFWFGLQLVRFKSSPQKAVLWMKIFFDSSLLFQNQNLIILLTKTCGIETFWRRNYWSLHQID